MPSAVWTPRGDSGRAGPAVLPGDAPFGTGSDFRQRVLCQAVPILLRGSCHLPGVRAGGAFSSQGRRERSGD